MKLLVGALLTIFSSTAMATNGGNLIGLSPASTAQGGAGVAHYMTGVDALYKNPALLSDLPGADGAITGEFYGNLMKQNASAEASSGTTSAGEKMSQSKAAFLPALGATYKLNDSFGLGLSAGAHGGARADYAGEATISRVAADQSAGRITLAAAYQIIPELSIGVAPYLNYSELKLHALSGGPAAHGATAFGAIIGVTSKPIESLSFGATFQQGTTETHKNVIDLAKLLGTPSGTLHEIKSGEPDQLGLGLAYTGITNLKLLLDYRLIWWSTTEGLRELAWKNQHVLAFGTEYWLDALALRLGFNWATSPIENVGSELATTMTTISGIPVSAQSISLFNVAAFPGISRTHLTAGAGYKITEDFQADLAFLYAFKNTLTRTGVGVNPTTGGAGAYTYTGRVSQWLIAAGMSYRF
jgi:long-chain fatty acid transport protein